MSYEFWLINWKLINPCLQVVKINHQNSGIRNYEKQDRKINGNVAFVYASEGIAEASKDSLMLFTLTNRVPIYFKITNWLINYFDNKNNQLK